MVHDGSGQGTHYCSKDEKPIYADADAGVYSTAAMVVQAVRWWLVADEGLFVGGNAWSREPRAVSDATARCCMM